MDELSTLSSIVDSITETLKAYPGVRVKGLRLQVRALSAVLEDSLRIC